MSDPISFSGIMAELGNFQTALANIHGTLQNPKHKAILGEILERIQEKKAEAEATIPPILRQTRERFEQTNADLKTESEKLRKQQKEWAVRLENAHEKELAKKTPPPKTAIPETRIDPGLGGVLRAELLERFGHSPNNEPHRAPPIKEAWEDWQ